MVSLILLTIIAASLINFKIAFRKSRDNQRKNDIRDIYDTLMKYQHEVGSFPLSQDGKIVACGGELDEKGILHLRPCEWYKDSLLPYLSLVHGDPQQGQGAFYYYLSNGKHFQIYGALESREEDEYEPKVVARDLPCGNRICNFGRSDGTTPLDKSLEEYENELREKENEKNLIN